MDKIKKIKEWISKEQDGLMDVNCNFRSAADEASYNILCNLDAYIDTLQKEPVSEDLNTAAKEYANNITDKLGYRLQLRRAVCFGAKWQIGQFENNRLAACDAQTEEEAEKDLELTWEDLATIEKLGNDFFKQNHAPMNDEEFYKEVLKRFKDYKEMKKA